ncbi:hypothetical protein AMJ50_02425 [Parcubacteria bacterium DG_74_3]|nr:MAG: hypothetical protein AMJ50_02425 [Parcubacteria bacterium DG_74_3]
MNFTNCKIEKEKVIKAFLVVITVFFSVLIILVGVNILNELKEGKYIGRGIEPQKTLTVSATGEVYKKPDLALVTFSVITEEKTVKEALSENTENMNGVIEFIKSQGIEEKDIKTTSFNIYPRYEWYETTGIPPYPQGERVLVGYEVHQSLEVKIRDLEKIGDIIQGAIDAGANQIGDLRLTIEKEDEFKKEARIQAIQKAKEQAIELSSQLGVKLVGIINFQESVLLPRFYGFESEVPLGMGGGEAPQIEAGETLISVTVSITYEIK